MLNPTKQQICIFKNSYLTIADFRGLNLSLFVQIIELVKRNYLPLDQNSDKQSKAEA